MKNFIYFIMGNFIFSGCIVSVSDNLQENEDSSGIESSEIVSDGIPKITNIYGNGSDTEYFKNGIYAEGENFSEDLEANLVNDKNETFYCTVDLLNANKAFIEFPEDIEENYYTLKLSTAKGEASEKVYILQGEKGEKGDKGDKGDPGTPGMTIVNMYGCPSSEDISPYPNEVLFLYYAYIYKYSDGSYKIDVAYKYYYEYDADTDFDSGTDSGWYAKDSVGVTNGILSTTGAWLEASYTISTKQIYIIDALSKTYSTTVDCIQLYP